MWTNSQVLFTFVPNESAQPSAVQWTLSDFHTTTCVSHLSSLNEDQDCRTGEQSSQWHTNDLDDVQLFYRAQTKRQGKPWGHGKEKSPGLHSQLEVCEVRILSAWHQPESSRERNLNWENSPTRSPSRHVCWAFAWLLTDVGGPRPL